MANAESYAPFEQRKRDHIHLALDESNQANGLTGLDQIHLQHCALPECDFEEISLANTRFGQVVSTPFLLSSMTAGHADASALNTQLARACVEHGWIMGVGSQRRELSDQDAAKEWYNLRQAVPKARLLGNIGLSQLIRTPIADIQRLVDNLDAQAMIIHTNPLQECLQPEGTPQFKGGLKALAECCKALHVPVVLKETGCGFSINTLSQLNGIGLAAVDISGLGGTHWGRIEGQRAKQQSIQQTAAVTFKNWGIGTVNTLLAAKNIQPDYELWGSGGCRTGLDAAKLLAMGVSTVGYAKPILAAALDSEERLHQTMQQFAYELKMALFLTGSPTIPLLQERQVWAY
ncbi:MAG: isopentenyl-diphosphate delta-isomerase [marine bacterium B5-7]|nr:MAG: isopentenyl-diphosphate delta-isomerase [marine bacterium B5-7]